MFCNQIIFHHHQMKLDKNTIKSSLAFMRNSQWMKNAEKDSLLIRPLEFISHQKNRKKVHFRLSSLIQFIELNRQREKNRVLLYYYYLCLYYWIYSGFVRRKSVQLITNSDIQTTLYSVQKHRIAHDCICPRDRCCVEALWPLYYP